MVHSEKSFWRSAKYFLFKNNEKRLPYPAPPSTFHSSAIKVTPLVYHSGTKYTENRVAKIMEPFSRHFLPLWKSGTLYFTFDKYNDPSVENGLKQTTTYTEHESFLPVNIYC